MMEYILIGKIVNTFGIKGELKVKVFTGFPEERFKKNTKVYLGVEKIPFICNSFKFHKGFMILSFKDNEDINLVEKYKNFDIYKSSDDIKPLKDNYYFRDLEGLDVIVDGEIEARVLNMEEGVTCNYLRVLKDDKEVLIPYLDQFIEEVNLDSHYIKIKKMEGLL